MTSTESPGDPSTTPNRSAEDSVPKPSSRKHHLVPAFHLAAFTNTGERKGLVTVTDLLRGQCRSGKPDVVGYRNDMNTLTSEGADPGALEKLYSSIEDVAAPAVLRTLEACAPPSGEDLHAICTLMAAQVVRSPEHRDSIAQFVAGISETMLQVATSTSEAFQSMSAALASQGVDMGGYDEMREFVRQRKVTVKDNDWLKAMSIQGFEEVAAMLAQRTWSVLVVTPECEDSFITADVPVKLDWTRDDLARGPSPPGFGMPNTRVLFPIGPRVMLWGEFDAQVQLTIPVERSMVAALNTRMAYGSAELYSPTRDYVWADATGVRVGADALLELFSQESAPID